MQQKEQQVILVVEDDDALRFLTMKQLQKLGFTVHSALNGREAVDKVAESDYPYSLLLMDVQMPKMDGIEATQLIRQLEASKNLHVPIIAMTAHPEEQRCLDAGMDDFIFKPVLLSQLKELLNKWIAVLPHAKQDSKTVA